MKQINPKNRHKYFSTSENQRWEEWDKSLIAQFENGDFDNDIAKAIAEDERSGIAFRIVVIGFLASLVALGILAMPGNKQRRCRSGRRFGIRLSVCEASFSG